MTGGTMIRRTTVVAVAGATLLVTGLVTVSGAFAAPGPALSFFRCCGNASAGWSTDSDAPGDTDGYSIKLVTAANGSRPASYSGATIQHTITRGEKLGDITALAFDASGFFGGGAPRISVSLNDGNVLYAYPGRPGSFPPGCDTQIGASDWYHAGFHNSTNTAQGDSTTPGDCVIYTKFGNEANGGVGISFTGDGTNSAWQNVVASDPTATIKSASLIQDAGPGTSYNDNLTFDSAFFTQP
jgi:hypothetical protein